MAPSPQPTARSIVQELLKPQRIPVIRDDDPELQRYTRAIAKFMDLLHRRPEVNAIFDGWWNTAKLGQITDTFARALAAAANYLHQPGTRLLLQDLKALQLPQPSKRRLLRAERQWCTAYQAPRQPQTYYPTRVMDSVLNQAFSGLVLQRLTGGKATFWFGSIPVPSLATPVTHTFVTRPGESVPAAQARLAQEAVRLSKELEPAPSADRRKRHRRPKRGPKQDVDYIERDVEWYFRKHICNERETWLVREVSGTKSEFPADQPGRSTVRSGIQKAETLLAPFLKSMAK